MRLIDADAFAEFLKDTVKRQKYEDTKIDGLLTVADVIEAVISELDGTSFDGFKNAPTIEPDSDTISRQQAIDKVSNNSPELAKENGELISRQAVLDAVDTITKWSLLDRNGCHVGVGMKYRDVKETVKSLPPSPSRPQIHCKDCKWHLSYHDPKYNVGYELCGNPKMMIGDQMIDMSSTDFCSNAEPKEGGAV